MAWRRSLGWRPSRSRIGSALVGDSADGYPGIPGWGAKSAAALLARFGHLEQIPQDPAQWGLPLSRALRLSESLRSHAQEVLLYRRLATLREDVPLVESLADLEWRGALPRLKELCQDWGDADLCNRVRKWQDG